MKLFVGCIYLYYAGNISYKYIILDVDMVMDIARYVVFSPFNSDFGTMSECRIATWNYKLLTPYQEFPIENNTI